MTTVAIARNFCGPKILRIAVKRLSVENLPSSVQESELPTQKWCHRHTVSSPWGVTDTQSVLLGRVPCSHVNPER